MFKKVVDIQIYDRNINYISQWLYVHTYRLYIFFKKEKISIFSPKRKKKMYREYGIQSKSFSYFTSISICPA